MLLVTTGLPESRSNGTHSLYLGDWCHDYRETFPANTVIQEFHWSDRKKIYDDYKYIRGLNEKILSRLREILNDVHGMDASLRYWQIVLGPWMNLITPILWDRFENLRLAFANHDLTDTIIAHNGEDIPVAAYYDDFIQLLNDDYWNHRIYSSLISRFYDDDISVHSITIANKKLDQAGAKQKESIKRIVAKRLDACLRILKPESRIVVYNSYFDPLSLVKLLLKFKQLPRLYTEFEQTPPLPQATSPLRQTAMGIQAYSDFEEFLDQAYLSLLPASYLEGFKTLTDKARKINCASKIILSAVSHYNNDLFKLWIAGNVEKGAKFLVCEHGGGIPFKMSLTNLHEEKVADRKIVWHKEYDPKQIKLPPSKLVRYSRFKRKSRRFIALIGWDVPKYSYYVQSGPMSSLILEDYAQKKAMIEQLDQESFDALIIRLAPGDRGWRIRERYIDDFGADKISAFRSMDDTIQHSRLVISTYPSTNLSESIEADIPTIMLYPRRLWEIHPKFLSVVDEMELNNIFFDDPNAAASHINAISDNPDVWWNSKSVQEARLLFHEYCGKNSADWLTSWTIFLKNEMASN
jgi:putative transferase (TIGR04331 family)